MTRKRTEPEPLNVDKALETLYGDKWRDLTSEGYIEAMRSLRKKDPAKARCVQRILVPYLRGRFFPRKQREWQETSQGLRARLALLPDNPHLKADVGTIREVLRLPAGHIHISEEDTLWKDLKDIVRPGRVRRVAEGNLASSWLFVHTKVAHGRTAEPEDKGLLSAKMSQSAVISGKVDLQSSGVPEWLRRPPVGTGQQKDAFAPLEWAASRLAERHNLPRYVVNPLTFYILTQDPSWITGLEPLDVEVSYGSDTSVDPDAFSVSVKRVDEFITKDDWDRIWTKYVRPRQENLWRKRGLTPRGRRTVDIKRLQRVMPLYQKMVTNGMEMRDLLRQPLEDLSYDNLDQEAIRRTIHDLQELLSPEA